MKAYHPHFSKVKEAILSKVSRPFVNISEVREVNAQVGDTGRVTPSQYRAGLEGHCLIKLWTQAINKKTKHKTSQNCFLL